MHEILWKVQDGQYTFCEIQNQGLECKIKSFKLNISILKFFFEWV